MIKVKIYSIVALVLFFLPYTLSAQSAYNEVELSVYDSTDVNVSKYKWAVDKLKELPDESYAMLKESYTYFSSIKDSAYMISCLLNMSDFTTQRNEYALSFQYLWEALFLANSIHERESIAVANRRLARLYGEYGMAIESMRHLKEALVISKGDEENQANPIQLNVTYRNIAGKKRALGLYNEALMYLDSCDVNDEKVLKHIPWFYTSYELEKVAIYMAIGDLPRAENHLRLAESSDFTHNLTGHISLYRKKGQLASLKGNSEAALDAYGEALKLLRKYPHMQIDNADLYRRVSKIYFDDKRYFSAYNYLDKAWELSDSLKLAQVKNLSEIFKINNSFQAALWDKNATIERQVSIIEDEVAVQNRLKIIIALLVLLLLTFSIVLRMRFKLRATVEEKEETELRAKLDEEQREKQMNLKNQELTSFALQLVDKETSVKELLDKIKELSPHEYKKINRKYQLSEKGTWEEFNIRFTEVNKGFYERLTAKFPNLSRTEQKHCALIKLNFSTKEMAQILNVEGHTINMSRSRIRKKMALDRADNLSNFIGTI